MKKLFLATAYSLAVTNLISSQGARDQCPSSVLQTVPEAEKSSLIEELIVSVEQGDLTHIKALLARGAPINGVSRGWTPLTTAVDTEQLEATKLLLEEGADPNKTNSREQSPLLLAVERKQPAFIRPLLRYKAKPEQQDNKGWTPLLLAVHQGDLPMIKALLEGSFYADPADPNVLSTFGRQAYKTPLMIAAEKGNGAAVEALIKAGAHLNQRGRNDMTALMFAAKNGHLPVVKQLLKAGAHINLQSDEQKLTALMFAAEKGHTGVVRELLKNGAESALKNNEDKTALALAARSEAVPVIQEFFKTGMNGQEELVDALLDNNLIAGTTLLEAGVSPNAVNQNDQSNRNLLVRAIERNEPEWVRLLLHYGADIEALDSNGNTALHRAAATGNLDIVEMLLEKGANRRIRNGVGLTPADIAEIYNHVNLVSHLKRELRRARG